MNLKHIQNYTAGSLKSPCRFTGCIHICSNLVYDLKGTESAACGVSAARRSAEGRMGNRKGERARAKKNESFTYSAHLVEAKKFRGSLWLASPPIRIRVYAWSGTVGVFAGTAPPARERRPGDRNCVAAYPEWFNFGRYGLRRTSLDAGNKCLRASLL